MNKSVAYGNDRAPRPALARAPAVAAAQDKMTPRPSPQLPEPLPTLRTLLSRGLRRRCPQCGEGRVFAGWLKMRERCDRCDLKYLANEGDLWAYLILIDRALFLFPLVVMIYFRINNPESAWTWVISGTLLCLFLYTLPHRNAISLGCDYRIRRKCGDLAEPDRPPEESSDSR